MTELSLEPYIINNVYKYLMPAPESCRGVNDTYPDLTPGPEQ